MDRIVVKGFQFEPLGQPAQAAAPRAAPAAAPGRDAVVNTVIAEAAGEGPKGMQAVANVIKNRAERRGLTPDAVVKQRKQFTGYERPGPGAVKAQRDPNVRAEAEKIVDGVITGALPDITGGADHYHADSIRPGWAGGLKPTTKIGGHDFYSSGGKPAGKQARTSDNRLTPNWASTQRLGDPSSPQWQKDNLTTIEPVKGQKWTVYKPAASAFDGLLKDLAAQGYNVKSSGGYNYRKIRGSNRISQHAFGTAIDLNAADNPLGGAKSNLPSNIRELAAKHGLVWGGDFKGRKDPMHFEYAGTVGDPEIDYGTTGSVTKGPGGMARIVVNADTKIAPDSLPQMPGIAPFDPVARYKTPVTAVQATPDDPYAQLNAKRQQQGLPPLITMPATQYKRWKEKFDANQPGVLSDIGTALWSGTYSTIGNILPETLNLIPGGHYVVDKINELDNWLHGTDPAKGTYLSQHTAEIDKGFSAAAKKASSQEWVKEVQNEDGSTSYAMGDAWKNPYAYMIQGAESIPGTVLTMLPVARLAKAAALAEYGIAEAAALSAGKTAEEAAEIAKKAASAASAKRAWIAGSAGEALVGGSQNAASTRDELAKVPIETWRKSEAFKALVDSGLTEADAIKQLTNDATTQSYLIAAVADGTFGGLGDRTLAKLFTEGVEGSLGKRIVAGAAKGIPSEMAEEIPQSAGEQVGSNVAAKGSYDPDRPLSQGVANAAAGGAVMGGLMGAGFGAYGGARSPAGGEPAPPATDTTEPPPAAGALPPPAGGPPGGGAPLTAQDAGHAAGANLPGRVKGPLERAFEHGETEAQRLVTQAAVAQGAPPPGTRVTVQIPGAQGPEGVLAGVVQGYDSNGDPHVQFANGDVGTVPIAQVMPEAGAGGDITLGPDEYSVTPAAATTASPAAGGEAAPTEVGAAEQPAPPAGAPVPPVAGGEAVPTEAGTAEPLTPEQQETLDLLNWGNINRDDFDAMSEADAAKTLQSLARRRAIEQAAQSQVRPAAAATPEAAAPKPPTPAAPAAPAAKKSSTSLQRDVPVQGGELKPTSFPDAGHVTLYDLGAARAAVAPKQRGEIDRVTQQAVADKMQISYESAGALVDDYFVRSREAANLGKIMQRVRPDVVKRMQAEHKKAQAKAAEPKGPTDQEIRSKTPKPLAKTPEPLAAGSYPDNAEKARKAGWTIEDTGVLDRDNLPTHRYVVTAPTGEQWLHYVVDPKGTRTVASMEGETWGYVSVKAHAAGVLTSQQAKAAPPISGKVDPKFPFFRRGGRVITMVDIGGVQVPFYISTGSGGKKDVKAGKWYPFFGVGMDDGWFNKGSQAQINDYYGNPLLREAAEQLDAKWGDIQERAKKEAPPASDLARFGDKMAKAFPGQLVIDTGPLFAHLPNADNDGTAPKKIGAFLSKLPGATFPAAPAAQPAVKPKPTAPVKPARTIPRHSTPDNLGDRYIDYGIDITLEGQKGDTAKDLVIARGKTNGHENMVIVDANGDVVGNGEGKKSSVALTSRIWNILTNASEKVVIHHNHPIGVSLSEADLSVSALPGVTAIYAHQHNGKISYRMAATKAGRAFLLKGAKLGYVDTNLTVGVKRYMEDATKPFIAAMKQAIVDGVTTVKAASPEFHHLSNLALQEAGIVDYDVIGRDAGSPMLAIPGIKEAYDKVVATHRAALGGAADAHRSAGPVRHTADLAVLQGRDGGATTRSAAQPDAGVGAKPAAGAAAAGQTDQGPKVKPPTKAQQGPALEADDPSNRLPGTAPQPGPTQARQGRRVVWVDTFGRPLLVTPTGGKKRTTVKVVDVGRAFDTAHRREIRKKLSPETSRADYRRVLDMARDEMRAQLPRENSGVGWYGSDVQAAIETTSRLFPTLATEQEHRDLYLTFAGLFSSGLDPDQAWQISSEAFAAYLATGVIPVTREEASRAVGQPVKMTTYKDDTTGEKITTEAGWGVRSPGNEQHLGFINHLIAREGGLTPAITWLLDKHPRSEINDTMTGSGLYKEGRYTTIPEKAGPPAYGFIALGPKLGRYTLGLHGMPLTHEDVTIDLWFTRTFRRWTGRLFDAPVGKEGIAAQPANDAERDTIARMVGELMSEFDLTVGDVQAVLWFFEKRLWGAHGLSTEEGSNSTGASRLVQAAGIDDGRGRGAPGSNAAAQAGTGAQRRAARQAGAEGGPSLEEDDVRDRLTGTPQFKRWFGKSKVVDEQGNPLPVYRGEHGKPGTKDFQSLLPSLSFGSAAAANTYAESPNHHDHEAIAPRVTPAYLKIENPVIENRDDPFIDLSEVAAKLGHDMAMKMAREYAGSIANTGNWDENFSGEWDSVHEFLDAHPERVGELYMDAYELLDDPAFVKAAKAAGYDGAIHIGNGETFDDLEYRIFDPKQAKSTHNRGTFDPDKEHILEAGNAAETLRETLSDVRDAGARMVKAAKKPDIKARLKSWWTGLTPRMLGAVYLNYMPDLAPASVKGFIERYLDEKRLMDTMRNVDHNTADKIVQDWRKFARLGQDKVKALALLMHDATKAGADPDDLNDLMHPEYAALKARFDALPEAGRDLYRKVRDAYKEQSEKNDQLIVDNVQKAEQIARRAADRVRARKEAEIQADPRKTAAEKAAEIAALNAAAAAAAAQSTFTMRYRVNRLRTVLETRKVKGPYFPLGRFGRFHVSVYDANGKLVHFSLSETEREANTEKTRIRRHLQPGDTVKTGLLPEKTGQPKDIIKPSFIAEIEQMLANAPAPLRESILDQIWQRYLQEMPELSTRTRAIHRSKIEGHSDDAMRVFASHMFHAAHQMAKLKHGAEMQDIVEEMGLAARDAPESENKRAVQLYDEMVKRNEWVMNPVGAKWSQMAATAAFGYYLGTSPAAAFVNLAQTPMVGIPIMAGRFGSTTRAAAAVARASRNAVSNRGMSATEERAIKDMIDAGVIDNTQSYDIQGVGEQGVAYNPLSRRVMRVMTGMFHNAEVINRRVTGLAAYRLAVEAGESHDRAVKTASDIVWKTHFDFSNSSRPRHLTSPVAKAVFAMRSYQINMLYRLGRDLFQSFKGATPQERREARYQLAGILGMQALFAGASGVAGYNTAFFLYGLASTILGAIFGNADDGDDPFTAQENFEATIKEMFGPILSSILLHGPVGTLTGVDLTTRVGMPDLWLRSPNKDIDSGDAAYNELLAQSVGAPAGILSQVFNAYFDMQEGHTWRGVETLAPKAIRDVLKSYRYMTEGVTTKQGEPIIPLDDTGWWSVIAQATGFTPAHIAEKWDEVSKLKGAEHRLKVNRQAYINGYALAVKLGDDAGRQDAIERIRDWNRSTYGRTMPIKSSSIQASLKHSAVAAGKRERGEGVLIQNEALRRVLMAPSPG